MKKLSLLANIFWILSLIIMVSVIKFSGTKLSDSAIILLNCIGYAFLLTSIILHLTSIYKMVENNCIPVIKNRLLKFLNILLKIFLTLITLFILSLSLLVTLLALIAFPDMPT